MYNKYIIIIINIYNLITMNLIFKCNLLMVYTIILQSTVFNNTY